MTCEAFPNGMAATNRIICYAKALLSAGVECEVLVYKRTELYGHKPQNICGHGMHDGISFRYISGTPLRGSNKFKRLLCDWIDEINTISYLKSNMRVGDAILCYMRELPFARRLQRFAHSKGYKIVRDLCEYPYGSGRLNNRTKSRCERYMRTTFCKYDGAVCISESLMNLAKRYNPAGSYVKIPIMLDENKWDFGRVLPYKPGYPYIFHSGTLLQQKDGIVDVLKAFGEALPNLPSDVKYLFTGNVERSGDKYAIEEVMRKYNLGSHICFLGYLPQDDLLKYMKGASLFIIYKNNNIQNQYCFATKLGEYLLSGNPVITTTVGEAKYYLTNRVNSYLIEPNNYKLLSETIITAFSDDNARRIGAEGRVSAKQYFTIQAIGTRLKYYFDNL